MPEKATSAQGGLPLSAVLELLRAARTGRHPKFWFSPRALVPRAPPLMTDSFLSALVARNRCSHSSRGTVARTRRAEPLSALVARNRCPHSSRGTAARTRRAEPLLALVARNRCSHSSRAGVARPVACATSLAPRWSRSSRADVARPVACATGLARPARRQLP